MTLINFEISKAPASFGHLASTKGKHLSKRVLACLFKFLTTLENWKGELAQLDDILIVALRF